MSIITSVETHGAILGLNSGDVSSKTLISDNITVGEHASGTIVLEKDVAKRTVEFTFMDPKVLYMESEGTVTVDLINTAGHYNGGKEIVIDRVALLGLADSGDTVTSMSVTQIANTTSVKFFWWVAG